MSSADLSRADVSPADLSRALAATPSRERKRFDWDASRLVGSRCEDCGAVSWPARAVCHRCGSAHTAELVLSQAGSLVTYTTVWVPLPGIEAPYTLGQVDLPDGVRVFAHVHNLKDGTLVPSPVTLVRAEEPESIPPFWFEPTEAT
ncbi:MAG: Zn-ribbon domain-containing OB-fold protein [Solirubrobacteraceae bacterium]